jgi:hypothetical protein
MKVFEPLIRMIDNNEGNPEDFVYHSFTPDNTGLHESYEITPDSKDDKRVIMVIRDPLFYSLQLWDGMMPIKITVERPEDKDGNIKFLFDKIKSFCEGKK